MPDDQALENELLDAYRALNRAEQAELRATAKKLAENPASAPQDPTAHAQ